MRWLAIDPRSAAAHYNLAQSYDHTDEMARAVEHYRKFPETAAAEHAAPSAAGRSRIEGLTRDPQ